MKKYKNILIVHTWGIGDMILFTPILQLLSEISPNTKIDFFITQKNSILPIKESKLYNKVIFSDYSIMGLLKSIKEIKKVSYDLCIHTSGISPLKFYFFCLLTKQKNIIGEYRNFKNPLYNFQIKFNHSIHRVESNFNLFKGILNLEIFPSYLKVKFFLNESHQEFSKQYFIQHDLMGKTVIGIHSGCNKRSLKRRWSKKYFIELIELIKSNYPIFKIIVFSGPDELEDSIYISKATHSLLVCNLSLLETASLIKNCDFFINTDSGLGHIASCYECISLTIFGPADPILTRPYSNNSYIIQKKLSCQPCEQINPKKCNIECLNDLSSIEVFKKFNKIINNEVLC